MLSLGHKFEASAVMEEAVARILYMRLHVMRMKTDEDRDGDEKGDVPDDSGAEPANERSDNSHGKGWEMVKRDENQEGFPARDASERGTLPVHWDPAYVVPLASLAHQLDLKDVLAFALYVCCNYEASAILQGSTFRDGTHARLSDDLLAKLMDGRARLTAWSSDYVWSMNAEPMGSPLCVRGLALDGCWADFEFMLESRFDMRKMHPVEVIDEWRRWCLEQSLCGHCVRWVEEEHQNFIDSLLETVIPECFDLL